MLSEPILLLETREGVIAGTLPDALSRLCDYTLTGFDGLAAHQRYAWDLFLYQLAALALHRSGEATAAEDDAEWRNLADPSAWRARLEALTPDVADTGWSLVVDDLTKPAFMQPPIGTGRLDGYSIAGYTPDEIDLLITAKNHDVKMARAATAEARHWLFALVTLQTLQGYSGRGNFGIARMNGGFASRPLVMRTPGRDLAACFRRGVQAALAARAKALDVAQSNFAESGLGLLWLEPWDREEGIPTQRLDPLFIEICRRVRLLRDAGGQITAWGRASNTARVATIKEAKGNLGDAWTPLNRAESSALTVGGGGFDYRLITRLIANQEFLLPEAAMPRADDPLDAVWLRCAVLVRGQGKTEGLHERWVRLPGRKNLNALSKLSQGMVADAAEAKQALKLALLLYFQGGPEKLKFDDRRPDGILDSYEQEVDRVFFDHLRARAAADDDDEAALSAEAAWRATLAGLARGLFEKTTETFSPPFSRQERAKALGQGMLNGKLRKAQLLPSYAETEEETDDAA
ncbi:hypothetical protein [Acidomonas methanolica]|uniref:CRISPR-associated protein Cse1 n=1 Tax=Acidomonas methanolica NBRC 104435 TaxID=1231351 RepID=A0A023D2K6_ACIMT|nr:hypothetical protein [Acidomonas methanolica]TCS21567.1 CRISPR system Cascade subunit CasA [Acidomonas methanolica]GAJ28388.1 CRISPR-associated protein Cse1 [Acidomonas methanolica NBRC 104435]GBQ45835.1 Cse1 family CRISPR-associated protein [Acidomonas methanolica]GEL00392.1 hypothetical protein AME01nite_28900 [Acidomonas methanolica NBRC 104435]